MIALNGLSSGCSSSTTTTTTTTTTTSTTLAPLPMDFKGGEQVASYDSNGPRGRFSRRVAPEDSKLVA